MEAAISCEKMLTNIHNGEKFQLTPNQQKIWRGRFIRTASYQNNGIIKFFYSPVNFQKLLPKLR